MTFRRRSGAGVVRHYTFIGEGPSFRDEVLAGLALPQKAIPPKYFYDDRGSKLFEAICELPEYYPTRTEMAIMERYAGEIVRLLGRDTQLVEFGSGASVKTRLLVESLEPSLYVPIDIAEGELREACAGLARRFPWLNINAVVADFARPLRLPEFMGVPIKRKVVYFPGSTIGNFTPEEAVAFLANVRAIVGNGGMLVIGVDLKKDKAVLEAAYDDAQGVTAAFNLNLLERINRELGGDFQLPALPAQGVLRRAPGADRDASREPLPAARPRRRAALRVRVRGDDPHRDLLQVHDRGVPPPRGRRAVPCRGGVDRSGEPLRRARDDGGLTPLVGGPAPQGLKQPRDKRRRELPSCRPRTRTRPRRPPDTRAGSRRDRVPPRGAGYCIAARAQVTTPRSTIATPIASANASEPGAGSWPAMRCR